MKTLNPKQASPETDSAATDEGALLLGGLALLGTLTGDGTGRALLRKPSGRIVHAELGERVSGRKIAAISDGQIILVRGDMQTVLTMPED